MHIDFGPLCPPQCTFFCVVSPHCISLPLTHSAMSWILSNVENLSSSNLHDEATDWLCLFVTWPQFSYIWRFLYPFHMYICQKQYMILIFEKYWEIFVLTWLNIFCSFVIKKFVQYNYIGIDIVNSWEICVYILSDYFYSSLSFISSFSQMKASFW